jgi:acetoin utilization deacetylase AcuC-like enzyme
MELLVDPSLARLHPTGHHGHPEREERLAVIEAELDCTTVDRPAGRADLERVHEPQYLAMLEAVRTETWLDPDTVAGPTSYAAAARAAGCAIEAVERSAFAAIRPPGHHALPAAAMGFCLVGNVVVAARHAQAELGVGRVAIVDWDVHHGNGTEACVRDDPTILFASLHQWPFYPGTGGPGTSDETTVNVPLPAGAGDDEVLEALATVVEPAVRGFDPGLLLVSAGFDAHVDDPLAGLRVTADGFRELARRCAVLAPRVAAVLEGGYNLATLPTLVAATIDGFESGGA